jgi:hypothetical protein
VEWIYMAFVRSFMQWTPTAIFGELSDSIEASSM